MPSKKWRELIKKVWEADPLSARSAHGKCASFRSSTRRMSSSASCAISGSGKRGCAHSGTDPPGETTLDPWLDDPFPDYDTEPVVAFSAT